VGTITPNSDAHPENEKKINVGFITARSIAGDIDANTMVVAGVSTFVSDISIADKIAHTGDSNTHLRFPNENEFLATVGGKETLRIASAGRVGIITDTFDDNGCKLVVEGRDGSTTSPARIQVKGNGNGYVHSAIDLVATNSSNPSGGQRGLGMFMYDSMASKEWFVGNPYGSADNFIIARKASGSRTASAEQAAGVTLLKIDSAGNVGLNTTSPQNSANYSTLQLTGTQIGGGQVAFKGGSNVHYMWTPGADFNIGCDYAGLGGGSINFKVNGNNTRMSIGSADVTITNGNLVVASGHGIDFSATSDATTANSELLDDYEEGVWVPVHGSSGGSVAGGGTYTNQHGTYTKVGDRVQISCYLGWNGDFSGAGGNYAIDLPFTSLNSGTNQSTYAACNIGFLYHSGGALASSNEKIGGYVSGSKLLLYRIPTGQGTGASSGGNVGNSTFSQSAGYVQFNLTMRV